MQFMCNSPYIKTLGKTPQQMMVMISFQGRLLGQRFRGFSCCRRAVRASNSRDQLFV